MEQEARVPMNGSFGALLRQLRLVRGLTQEELAERAGLSVRGLSDLERGVHQRARPETLTLLAKALGLNSVERANLDRLLHLSPARRPSTPVPPPDLPRHNLPLPATSFVGRERELAEVTRLLATSHLVTLTGAGGCGKTRLALQVAANLITTYPDGCWLVDLAPLADPALVPSSVASVLDVSETPGRPLLATIRDALLARALLMVLDNCEHLIDACASLAAGLLQGCPHIQLLITSRELLGVPGEVTFRVPSLTLPSPDQSSVDVVARSEGIQLFVERARAFAPDFTVTHQNAPVVAQICRRLDGIPLAIELAAARIRVLTSEQIAARLDDRFRLLTGGARTALRRQQTLQALIDWSHDLLSEREQALFRRLAVFAGAWTIEAAEAACAFGDIASPEVLDLLASLTDKSLVVSESAEGAARFRLLETIRQYAADKLLRAGEAVMARDQHRDWFLELAELAEPELIGPRQREWLDRLEAENDNLRAALGWAIERGPAESGLRLAGALGWLWAVRDQLSEGQGWLERALSATRADVRTTARAKALDCLGIIAHLRGDLVAMRHAYEECLAVCEEIGERQRAAWAVRQLGFQALGEGNAARAETLFAEALARARKIDDRWVSAQSLEGLGLVAAERGNIDSSRRHLSESLEFFRQTEDWRAIGTSLLLNGNAAAADGDVVAARACLAQAVEVLRELRSKDRVILALCNLGIVTRMGGDPQEARELLGEACAAARAIGTKWVIAYAQLARALLARAEANDALTRELAAEIATTERASIGEPFYRIAFGLQGVLAIDRAADQRGVRILSAVAAHRIDRLMMLVGEYETYQEALARARARLGEKAYATAWIEGYAMTRGQAVAYALADDAG